MNGLIGLIYHADFYNNDIILKYQNTYPLKELFKRLMLAKKMHETGFQGGYVKFYSLLMHDTNLLSLLKAFGLSSYECIK